MTEAEIAWLAALIDGEGSVMLSRRTMSDAAAEKRKAAGRNYRRKRHYRAVITISNTHVGLLNRIVEVTGINRVYHHARAEKLNHRKESYTWRMVPGEIRILGPQLLPWLVVKREQMELLLEALDIADKCYPRKGQKWVLDPALIQRRDEIVTLISQLNRKGRFEGGGAEWVDCQ